MPADLVHFAYPLFSEHTNCDAVTRNFDAYLADCTTEP